MSGVVRSRPTATAASFADCGWLEAHAMMASLLDHARNECAWMVVGKSLNLHDPLTATQITP